MMKLPLLFLPLALMATAGEWSAPLEIRHDDQLCVTYRAKTSGEFLVVEAKIENGWHTNAMDNKQRAQEKLGGRKALGVDAPTEISAGPGLEVVGPWYQTPPKDASKPDLLWFTWVFENQATFTAKVKRTGDGPAVISIKGQACTETTCKKIDENLTLPLSKAGNDGAPDLTALLPVKN